MDRDLEARSTTTAGVDEVRRILRDSPAAVLGDPEPDPQRLQAHRFHTSVCLQLGSGTSIEQDVCIDLDTVPAEPRRLIVGVRWEPLGHQTYLPSFAGWLSVAPADEGSTLELRGRYEVPFGAVGRFGDALVGGRIARATVEDLVERLAGDFGRLAEAASVPTGPKARVRRGRVS